MTAPHLTVSPDPVGEAPVEADPSASGIAEAWLRAIGDALGRRDEAAIAACFHREGWWRDILALTWDMRTFAGPAKAARGLVDALRARSLGPLRLESEPQVVRRRAWGRTVETFFTFDTDIARCRGHVRLVEGPGGWQAWTVLTGMEDLIGHEETVGARRRHHPKDAGPTFGRGAEAEVLVVGAAQSGLAIAARLRQLGIGALVIDKLPRIGDVWRKRYQSLVLHNQIWANHLPYITFPSSWPAYVTKEQMADWLEAYAKLLDIDVRTSTSLGASRRDETARRWEVELRGAKGSVETVRPRHVVLATGVFGIPNRPHIPGQEDFTGTFIHAGDYPGGADMSGRRVLVVGTGTSGHDVAQELCNNGAEVTMLQRSSTCVISVEPGAARFYSIYSENGLPVVDADFISNSFPFPLVTELHKEVTKRVAEMDRELLDGLHRAGFATDFGDDGSGFLLKYHRTGGGYYINVGCSELIVAGQIKVKHGVEIDRLSGRTVRFTDGSAMDVDMVVVAAGYQNMSTTVRALFGDRVADRVGPVWGFDDEGEVRAMWRRTGQPGFWLMGGSLQQVRPYSKYLALQIKASELGLL